MKMEEIRGYVHDKLVYKVPSGTLNAYRKQRKKIDDNILLKHSNDFADDKIVEAIQLIETLGGKVVWGKEKK